MTNESVVIEPPASVGGRPLVAALYDKNVNALWFFRRHMMRFVYEDDECWKVVVTPGGGMSVFEMWIEKESYQVRSSRDMSRRPVGEVMFASIPLAGKNLKVTACA